MPAENVDLLYEMAGLIQTAVADADWPIQVWPMYLSSPTPPAIDMFPGSTARGTQSAAFGPGGEFLFTVRARVTDNDEDGNVELLMHFMDDYNDLSLGNALLTDPTLNGLATDLSIPLDLVTGIGEYRFGTEHLLGFQFTCMVIRADS